VADRKKCKDIFDRPKPTVGCSANGRRRSLKYFMMNTKIDRRERTLRIDLIRKMNIYMHSV